MFSNMDFFGFFSSFIFKENHVFNEEDNPSKKKCYRVRLHETHLREHV